MSKVRAQPLDLVILETYTLKITEKNSVIQKKKAMMAQHSTPAYHHIHHAYEMYVWKFSSLVKIDITLRMVMVFLQI